jgi:hypothetical protein
MLTVAVPNGSFILNVAPSTVTAPGLTQVALS